MAIHKTLNNTRSAASPDAISRQLHDEVKEFIKNIKPGTPVRTTRRMIYKKFGDRMRADIDRITALKGKANKPNIFRRIMIMISKAFGKHDTP